MRFRIKHEAVALRFNDRKDLCANDGLGGQVGQHALRGGVQVGLLPFGECALQFGRTLQGCVRQHELLEIVVGEVAMHVGLASLETLVGFGSEQSFPIAGGDGLAGILSGKNREDGVGFSGVKS